MTFQTYRSTEAPDRPEAVIDLSSGRSSIVGLLSPQCRSSDPSQASVLHMVLPPLSQSVEPGGDPCALAIRISDALWQVFSSVREWHRKLHHSSTPILVWAWPGETTDRPNDPSARPSEHVVPVTDALSLLPSLSGLLRCMALELERPIILLSAGSEPMVEEVRDATAFLVDAAIQLGDFSLTDHRLRSHEPRIANHPMTTGSAKPFAGHILSLGGARGIVAQILLRLTTANSHLSLVGRTSLEQPDAELTGLASQDLMRTLMQRHRLSGDQASVNPRSLQRQVDKIRRQEALGQHLSSLRQIVETFDYHSADLSDSSALTALLDQESMADISVLISGAGVIQDQSCLTKSRDSFDAVLRTKVVPLCVLLCRGLPPLLKSWVSFSSIASKSGNPGQADYAAANEFLNTVVHWFSRRHADIRMHTINWGPWQGSGMASTEVLAAFHNRGLEPIEPDAGAEILQQILLPESAAVEVSAVALKPEVMHRLERQQSLMSASSLWNYHSLPPGDSLASDQWPLLFHGAIPYLQGHRKNDRAVVPAACVLCLAADLAAALPHSPEQPLRVSLYVFHGITMSDGSAVVVQAQSQIAEDGQSGLLVLKQARTERPYYKANWSWTAVGNSEGAWRFTPELDGHTLMYCERADVYSACLFHSGVMASLCDRVVIDSAAQTSWCRARPAALKDQLGLYPLATNSSLPNRDLTLVDALLQLLLVQTIETLGLSALPQELSLVLLNPMPVDGEVQLTAKITKIEGTRIEAIGACQDGQGNLLFVMEKSIFTASKDLLDYPPGISYS
jgi:NAD(P)-dependent dehydrogenase (short-subunit alcohol dehydrogenase family)